MRLKDELRKELKGNLETYKKLIDDTTAALEILETTNLRKANYRVTLNSCWAGYGEQTITLHTTGSLEDAIKNTESEFKDINKRGDVQANYFVRIVLGQHECHLPKCYWEQYTEKNRK